MSLTFATIAIRCVRGATWRDTVLLTDADTGDPISLSDATEVTMRVRRRIESSVVLMELSIANGRISIADAVGGELAIEVSAEDTLDFPLNNNRVGKYVFDSIITRPSGLEPGFKGKLTVQPQVTRLLPEPT